MKTKSILMTLLANGLICGGLYASSLTVAINTAPVQGQSGHLVWDLIGGSPVQNNSLIVSGFASNSVLGSMVLTGSAIGTLVPGPLTLNNSQFFNEVRQAVTFGATASFVLDFTTNVAPGGIPD